MSTTILLVGALMVMLSILFTPLSQRAGLPVLLIFLVVGILAGEDGLGVISFDNESLAFTVGNLALAIILLDGGMRTRAETFRVGLWPALTLATWGVACTAGIVALTAWWLLDLSPLLALLLGAIVSSTDAAAVFSLLQGRSLHLNERVSATLEIESGTNDPMAIFLTLLLIQWLQNPAFGSGADLALLLASQLGIGAIMGWAGGRLLSRLIQVVRLVPAMYPLLVMAFGVSLFALTNEMGGSGFLAIYLAGVVLASRRVRMMPTILQVHDGLAWLAQMSLFLILGLLVTPHEKIHLAGSGLLIGAILILVARPLAVVAGLWPFGFRGRELAFISWVGLRGAVPIVLALFPVMAGIPQADTLFTLAFYVVVLSLLVQGTTLTPLARCLRLEVPHVKEPLRRMPLDMHAVGDHEIFLYPLKGERWQQAPRASRLRLPAGTVLAGLFRDGELLNPEKDPALQEGDVAAVLAAPGHLEALGRTFTGRPPPRNLSEQQFFGEFVLNGDATLGDLQQVYGAEVPASEPQEPLWQFIRRHIRGGHPVIGDRVKSGPVTLVVRAVEGDRATKVGLNLHE